MKTITELTEHLLGGRDEVVRYTVVVNESLYECPLKIQPGLLSEIQSKNKGL